MSIDPLLRREGTSRNGWQPRADALLTLRSPPQLLAVGSSGLQGHSVLRRGADLRAVATGCPRSSPQVLHSWWFETAAGRRSAERPISYLSAALALSAAW